MKHAKVFVSHVHNKGLYSALSAVHRYLNHQWRQVEQRWRYEAELDPFRTLWIDPHKIHQENEKVVEKSNWDFTYVIGGDWDKYHRSFEQTPFIHQRQLETNLIYQSLVHHFKHDTEWNQTKLYEQVINGDLYWRGINTEEEFQNACDYLDDLYNSMRKIGYQTYEQRHGSKPTVPEEIKIKIGREGEFFFVDGKHRVSIAKILDLNEVAVNVFVRHSDWQRLREEIVRNETGKLSSQATMKIEHPDIRYLR